MHHLSCRDWILATTLTVFYPHTALAQITPDLTLDVDSSTVAVDVPVQGALADLIEGGAIRGTNLFHSFVDFNVAENQRVYFANPAGIEAILSRVTSRANPSNILGTLGVDGPADLFFVNPNGVFFGENVQLDVPGAFHATTGEGIPLGNQAVFSAIDPQPNQLLAVAPGVNFFDVLTEQSGDIVNQGQLSAGEALTLAAGTVQSPGRIAAGGDVGLLTVDSIVTGDIATPGGNVLLESRNGSVTTPPETQLNTTDGANDGGHITVIAADSITLDGSLDSSSGSSSGDSGDGGDITLSTQSGDITTNGILRSSSRSFSGSSAGDRGNITLSTQSGDITTNDSLLSSSSAGDGGDITLSTQSGDITTNARLDSDSLSLSLSSSSAGDGGNITLSTQSGDITTNAFLDSSSSSYSDSSAGDGGDITLSTQSGDITTNERLDSSSSSFFSSDLSSSAGDGGNITLSTQSGDITTNERLDSSSFSFSFSSSFSSAGDGGDITLSSKSGNIVIGNSLFAFVRGGEDAGNGGNISLAAPAGNIMGNDFLVLTFAVADAGGTAGQGGAVTLTAQNTISNLPIITVSSAGDSGPVRIQGTGDLTVRQLFLITSADALIPAPNSTPSDPQFIEISVGDTEQAGDVFITSAGDLTLNAVAIRSDANGVSDAGDILIFDAGDVQIIDSTLTSNSNAAGNGGNLTFENLDSLVLDGSELTTNTLGRGGDAGNIVIPQIDTFSLRNGSLVQVTAQNGGNAGNIDILARVVEAVPDDNNDILANAEGGRGGEIRIIAVRIDGLTEQPGFTVDELRALDSNDVSASSLSPLTGIVELVANTRPTPTDLPDDFVDTDELVSNSCIRRIRDGKGRFVITGSSGLPKQPGDTGSFAFPTNTIRAVPDRSETSTPASYQPGQPIREAQGVYLLADGRLVLSRACQGEARLR